MLRRSSQAKEQSMFHEAPAPQFEYFDPNQPQVRENNGQYQKQILLAASPAGFVWAPASAEEFHLYINALNGPEEERIDDLDAEIAELEMIKNAAQGAFKSVEGELDGLLALRQQRLEEQAEAERLAAVQAAAERLAAEEKAEAERLAAAAKLQKERDIAALAAYSARMSERTGLPSPVNPTKTPYVPRQPAAAPNASAAAIVATRSEADYKEVPSYLLQNTQNTARTHGITSNEVRSPLSRFKHPKLAILAGGVALAGVIVGGNQMSGQLNDNEGSATIDTVIAQGPLSAENIAIADYCLDDASSGKAMLQGNLSAEAEMRWWVETNGQTSYLQLQPYDETTKVITGPAYTPAVTIPVAPTEITGCLPKDQLTKAVTIKGDTVTLDRSAVTPQMAIERNTVKGATPSIDALDKLPVDPSIGMTEQVVAEFKKKATDPNLSRIAISLLQQQAFDVIAEPGSENDKKIDSALDQKLTALMNEQIELHKSGSTDKKDYKVTLSGDYKTIEFKGAVETVPTAFDVVKPTLKSFNPVNK